MPYNFTTEIDQRFLRELKNTLDEIEQLRQGIEVDERLHHSQRSFDWLTDMRVQIEDANAAIQKWIQDSEFRP